MLSGNTSDKMDQSLSELHYHKNHKATKSSNLAHLSTKRTESFKKFRDFTGEELSSSSFASMDLR